MGAYELMNIFDTWTSERSIICDEVTDETFNDIFSESPKVIAQKASEIKNILNTEQELTLKDNKGSNLTLRYQPGSASLYDGFQSHEHNIPSGEIAYVPLDVTGILNFEGWIIGTIPFGQKYGKVKRNELVLKFKNGRITDIKGENESIKADFKAIFAKNIALAKVAEIGIGVNEAVTKACKRSQVGYEWMEKKKGLHLGLGAELTEHIDDYKNRKTHHHLDLVVDSGSLSINEKIILSW